MYRRKPAGEDVPKTKSRAQKNESSFRNFTKQYKLQERAPLILTIIAVALLGLHWLYAGHAATFATSKEAENGTVAGNATIWNGANASNGQAVRFGGNSFNVVGNKIIGPNGKPYAPYGFILECLAFKNPTSTSACNKAVNSDSDKIKATAGFWHGNTVRLQVASENLLDQSPYDSAFMNLMDKEVNLATNLGMVTILTMQQEEYQGPIFLTPDSVTFWKIMADHYKNNPYVFFDMFNEPKISISTTGSANNMWNIWQNGGVANDGKTYVGYQTVVNAIRGQGANNIIIAEGPATDSTLGQLPTHYLKGANIAYGIETNLYPGSRTPTDWYNEWGQYKKVVPIMPEAFRDNIGKECDPDSPTDVPALLSYEKSIGMGVLYWTLASGIVTTNANLTTPTTYAGHTTITCPTGGPADIDPANTIGPGADLLAWFKAND